jgi:hypothetical protein
MGWQAELRAHQAHQRRLVRDAKRRQRELERQAKEAAKLTALEQARLEVETYENALEVLLSVHKEQADPTDWPAMAVSLPPVPPVRSSSHEHRARQRLAVSSSKDGTDELIQQAKERDDVEYQEASQRYAAEHAEWERLSRLAQRILSGDTDAYVEAIQEDGPFAELATIGSSLHFSVHDRRLVECAISTRGRQAIPTEQKSMTSAGKVSVKAMPRQRFVEVYQDYVCGCVLRIARELFALLPIETVLITASAEALDSATGQMIERPFLSVAISRATLNGFDFDRLDPSDSVLSLAHRGDLKASRKTGDFEFVVPLSAADLPHATNARSDYRSLLTEVQRLKADLAG